jgi:hypothetical protein
MNKERVALLLASGLKQANVASIVGCSPALISQLMSSDAEFRDLYAEAQTKTAEKDQEELAISAKYLTAEHALLDQVLNMAPASELRDVVGALRVISERQDRARSRVNPIPLGGNVVFTQNIVQLSLPGHAIQIAPVMTRTKDNEITAIEGQNLAPLSSQGVTNLFKNLKQEKEIQNERPRISSEAEGCSEEVIPFLDSCEEIVEIPLPVRMRDIEIEDVRI